MTADTLTLPGLDHRGHVGAVATGEGAAAPTVKVYGLDLSLTGTGISDGHMTWLIGSKGGKDDTLLQRRDRLRNLAASICLQIHPAADLVLIEGPAFSKTTGHMHDRSGLWWLVVNSLIAQGIPVAEVTPTAVKKYATGRGNASKAEVIDATTRRYPDVETKANDNRCDAFWLAAMGIDHLTGQHNVPAVHRSGLDKVHWPVTA